MAQHSNSHAPSRFVLYIRLPSGGVLICPGRFLALNVGKFTTEKARAKYRLLRRPQRKLLQRKLQKPPRLPRKQKRRPPLKQLLQQRQKLQQSRLQKRLRLLSKAERQFDTYGSARWKRRAVSYMTVC